MSVCFAVCLLFFSPFRRKSLCIAHMKKERLLKFHLLGKIAILNELEFCIGDCASIHLLIDSLIHLYQYRFIDIYFLLWVIFPKHIFILLFKLFHLWPLGVSFRPSVHVTYSSLWDFWSTANTLLSFWHYKMLQALFYISSSRLKISHFSKNLCFLLFEYDIRNQNLGVRSACHYRYVALGTLSFHSKDICICVYKYYLSVSILS